MNDTTRDEVRERIEGELLAVYTIGYDREVADIVFHAKRIIGLVTAARDAEIREAYAEVGRYAEKVLGEIGLHGDATGGQG